MKINIDKLKISLKKINESLQPQEFYDAWLLLTIVTADRGNGASLKDTFFIGDSINRAIFSESELIEGLHRLDELGLIFKKNKLLFQTDKIKDISALRTFQRGGSSKRLEIIMRYLRKLYQKQPVKLFPNKYEIFVKKNYKISLNNYYDVFNQYIKEKHKNWPLTTPAA